MSLGSPNYPTVSRNDSNEATIADRTIIEPREERATVLVGHGLQPIEISLIVRMAEGIGDLFVRSSIARMQAHPAYVYEYGEHSALVLRTSDHDPSAIYHLAVDDRPLEWHRHPDAAHRILTITTGSGGAIASFALATEAQILDDPQSFVRSMVSFILPADSQVCLRFPGQIYHQFGPNGSGHPAFAGISIHKNERQELLEVVRDGWGVSEAVSTHAGTIPDLTRCLAPRVKEILGHLPTQDIARFSL